MRAILPLVLTGLRLNARNRMALLYGYLFPLIFLIAFWALYRHDRVPLLLHMGALLTVTVLGGACFGLPTALVSEREQGVWRRYRLTPVPAAAFIAATLVTRALLLASAALLQIALALAIGMIAPAHPLGLLAAFGAASVAFIGCGLVIAAVADSVPTVQALGQCIFLPMLIVGGVAVPIASLPGWAQMLSAFLPGRYAVEAMQACVTGGGPAATPFALLALLAIGAAAMIAAWRMFHWDPHQRPARGRGGKAWLLLALGMWAAIGLIAVATGRAGVAVAEESAAPLPAPAAPRRPAPPPAAPPRAPEAPARAAAPAPPARASWRGVTAADIAAVAYDRLPPDAGVVTPIAASDEAPDDAVAAQLDQIRAALRDWPPAHAPDPVQRVRNLLYVAAVPDVLQMEQLERFLPVLVYERLRADLPKQDLTRLLYWVAMHPEAGSDAAVRALGALGLPDRGAPARTVRVRVMLYALKLLGRQTGAIVQQ